MRTSSIAFRLLATSFLCIESAVCHAQIAATPIPGISVEIADVIQFPDTRNLATEDSRVRQNIARINFLREVPGSDRWFVNDLRGFLYSVNPATQSIQTYLDLNAQFSDFRFGSSGLSTGFLSMTPHPEFATNGKFYTLHTELSGSSTPDFIAQGNPGNITLHEVLNEWTATAPAANVFAGTRREVMRTAAPAGFLHGQGDVQFNPLADPGHPDYGLLYIGGGDFGYDAYNKGTAQAQNLSSVYGKILRIDPAGSNSLNGKYGIPATNPYASDGDPGTREEIYASGFRNAHRIMWDLETGVMYTTDIGQNNIEEINIVHPGANYGWRIREGTFTYNGGSVGPLPPGADTDGFTYPVAQYDHDEGNAIAGGFVYRGAAIPELVGKFVYGDIVRGRIFYSDVADLAAADDGIAATTAPVYELFLTRNGAPTTLEDLIIDVRGAAGLPSNRHDLRFGQTSDGEIYVMTKMDGYVRKLVATPGPSQLILSVDRRTGEVRVRNASNGQIAFDMYAIASASGSLNPANGAWNSLADQGLSGWMETSQNPANLSEQNLSSDLQMASGSSRSLGAAYKPAYAEFGTNGPEDLQFQYITPAGVQVGVVEYSGLDVVNNLRLIVDPATGRARLENPSPFNVVIDGYSFLSFAGSLRPDDGDWLSFADRGMSDWVEADPTPTKLSELNPLSEMLLASGAALDMGRLFDPNGEQDIEFEFKIEGQGEAHVGVVLYESLRLTGDYNDDGAVDAADYVAWRGALGQEIAPFSGADGDGDGVVNEGDYAVWRERFGSSSSSAAVASAATAAVPEPPTLVLLAILLPLWRRASAR